MRDYSDTPGHTEGGCCYYIGEEHVLFSGDTLFHNSIGRTDLPTGSGSELVRSVKRKTSGFAGRYESISRTYGRDDDFA
ncbi:MAG: MBL fold metallo-hydrolase [[Ruminococcus] torques]